MPPVPPAPPRPPLAPDLAALLRTGPVFDAHADSIGLACDLGVDLAEGSPGQLDLVRGAAGGLGAWVVVCWVDPERYLDRAAARADAMMDAADALAARRPDRFRLVRSREELVAARRDGVVAGVLGIEGGHALEESRAQLEHFVGRGLRVLTLVWNNHLSWIRSCMDGAGAGVPAGLSPFGRELVRALNANGVVVDLSHASERAFYETLEQSARPVLASHSGCRALHDHPRNLTDAQLRALRDNGGVCGIVFHPGFLSAEARAEQARVRATESWHAISERDPARRHLEEQRRMAAEMRPFPLDGVVEHVEHAVEVAGIDHVGIGSDYDGIECGPQGLEHAGCYGALAERLHARGFTIADVDKVLGRNVERVFAAATA